MLIDSLCECLLVSSLNRLPIKKVVLKEKSTTLVCNSHGRGKCHTICSVYAVMNREHIPNAVCQVLGNGEHLNVLFEYFILILILNIPCFRLQFTLKCAIPSSLPVYLFPIKYAVRNLISFLAKINGNVHISNPI